jgi:putative DNA primase/helicase
LAKYLHDVLYPAEVRTAVECMAYTLYRDNPFEVITLLFGYGSNGKSVFTDTLTALHGTKNVSNVSLSGILKNQFALSDLEGKDVNIDSELSNITIYDTAILKKLTGRQPIRIERKNQRAYDTKLHTKLWFSANKIPQTADNSDAYYRRIPVISLPHKFEGQNADPDLSRKLTTEEELSGVFNVLMIALRRILHNKGIYLNEKTIQERRDKYEMASNPIGSFIEQMVARDCTEDDKTPKEEFYRAYVLYCKENNLPIQSKENFGKILKRNFSFQEGRESSDLRRPIWKKVRLVVELEEEQQNEKYADYVEDSGTPQSPKQFN